MVGGFLNISFNLIQPFSSPVMVSVFLKSQLFKNLYADGVSDQTVLSCVFVFSSCWEHSATKAHLLFNDGFSFWLTCASRLIDHSLYSRRYKKNVKCT